MGRYKELDLLLRRDYLGKDKTLGTLLIKGPGGETLFILKTLELPWKNNEQSVSCIPSGYYEVVKHKSPRFNWSLLVKDVPNRSGILFHVGNYTREIRGCILPGLYHDDIDNDGITDVVYSSAAISVLKHYTKSAEKIKLLII